MTPVTRAVAAAVGAVIAVLMVGGCGRAVEARDVPVAATFAPSGLQEATGPDGVTPRVAAGEIPADDAPVPVADPTRVIIKAIGVDATITAVGLRADGEMAVPDFGLAGWYDEGPRPGEAGPAVVVAHVSSSRGPDVFERLDELRTGDQVVIARQDGTRATWAVTRSEQTHKDDLPVDRIWDDTRRPVLRLITCGGTIQADGHYDDNVIVYAEPVEAVAAPPGPPAP